MKQLKKYCFKIHGWIGINLSILFFIVCFTGTLATISHEIDWLFFPEIRAQSKGSEASKNLMAANIKKAYPNGDIMYWPASTEPYLCNIVHVNLNNQRYYVFVNPYTGEVQGGANITIQRFLRDFHYFLFIPFQIGHFTVLIFGFLLFISTITALFFYKKWWKKLFTFKSSNNTLSFYRNCHRLIGIWSVPFTIIFSITGIWYFLERTNTAHIRTIANPTPPSLKTEAKQNHDIKQLSYTIDYDAAIKKAQKAIPNLIVKDIKPPSKLTEPLYLTGIGNRALVRNRANRVYLHPNTLEVISVQNANTIAKRAWLNDIADPIHFGTWGGINHKNNLVSRRNRHFYLCFNRNLYPLKAKD